MSKMNLDKEKLTEEKLIFGAGFIDDDLVDEAIDYKPRRMSFIPWACTAAAAVVLVAAIAIIARLGGNTEVLPPDVVSSGLSTPNASTDPNASKDPEHSGGTSQCVPDDSSSNSGNLDNSSVPPVTTSDIPVEPIGDQKSYADIFEEFYPQNPSTYGPPPTCEEIANRLTPNPDFPENDVDSYYLIEVVRALTNEEYELIRGASTGTNGNTLYEVILVEDWITGKAIDRKAYVEIPAGLGAAIQLKGDPTYASGEKFTAALTKPQKNWNDIYSTGYDLMRLLCDYTLRYDLPDMDFTSDDTEAMLYFRGKGQARRPISDLPITTEEIIIETVTSTPQNPATYIQKIAVGDFIDFIRELWQQAGLYVPEQNPPTIDIGNGMTLTGTPLDSSELEDYPINSDNWKLDSAAEEFIDGLEIHAFDKLVERAQRLTEYCLNPIEVSRSSAVPTSNDSAYIQSADGVRYYETGYTYKSFYNEYSRTFTKEVIEEMFNKNNHFLNYNGELYCDTFARNGDFGDVHREYELIDKGNTSIEFRMLRFRESGWNRTGKYDPALRDEYDLGVTDFEFLQIDSRWLAANIPREYETSQSYLSPNEDFSVNRVYADDEVVPSNWLPVMSRAECMANIEEVMNIDTAGNFTEGVLSDLMNKNILCFGLFYGVSRDMFYIEWDDPYDYPDYKNPVYPIFPKQPGFLKGMQSESIIHTIYDLPFDTYENSVAAELLYGVSDLKDELRYLVKDGQLYINNHAFPNWSSDPFVARSYVEVIERSDNKRTFIWHYPDTEYLNHPQKGYEYYYYEKTYTAEYIEGSWKLTKVVFNNAESS